MTLSAFRTKSNVKYLNLNFFAILNILCLVSFFVDVKLGIASSVLIIFYFLVASGPKAIFTNAWFAIYLFFNIISVVGYLDNGRPISVFFSALSFNVIPSLLFLVGFNVAKCRGTSKVLGLLLDAIIFMMIFGTVTYIIFPSFYYKYVGASIDSYTYGLGDYRYGSFISSLALGSIGTIALVVYFKLFGELPLFKRVFYLLIIILNIVMCMQRSAWLLSFIALAFCLFNMSRNKKIRKRIIFLGLLLIVLGLIFLSNAKLFMSSERLNYYMARLSAFNFKDLVFSRSEQWIEAWDVFLQNPLFGLGLGSCGQKAVPYNLAVVTDGNHLRILAETGIFGFVPFVALNVIAVSRCVKKREFHLGLIIVLCNFAAIGSPIFDQFYSSFAYWFILGMAISKNGGPYVPKKI